MADERDKPPSPDRERLDSWKEIAAYLKRSVRSVQRWEAEEAMPVHRHVHDKRGTIYGFKDELRDWWTERGSILLDQNGAEHEAVVPEPEVLDPAAAVAAVETPRRQYRKAALTGTSVALVILVVGAVAWLSRDASSASSQSLPFKARDWVLVTSFENRTGERLFDGTLEYALTRELANSRYVNVVSRERIEDALRLMRKPPDTRVDAAVGREVCLRDGEIRALLAGRAERFGAEYLFSVEIVEPTQGTTMAGFTEKASGKEGSLSALRRISNQVRRALGETAVPGTSGDDLAKVTTSSLKALQLYSRADQLLKKYNPAHWPSAEELLKQSVAEDPSFASAYVHLAHVMNNQRRPVDEFRPYLETALRLSDSTPERERYFIRGSYHDLLGQKEQAAAAYEALIALYPDHPWAWGSLTWIYEYPRDIEKLVMLEQRLADLRPNDYGANMSAAWNFLIWLEDSRRAEPYLRRGRAILAEQGYTEETSINAGWYEVLPVAERWLAKNPAATLKELDEVADRLEAVAMLLARELITCRLGHWYLTLGRLDEAERLYRTIADPVVRDELLVQVSVLRGETARVRDVLERRGKNTILYPTSGATAVLVARSGLTGPLQRFWFERAAKRGTKLWRVEVLRGEIAMSRGETDEAISLLQKGTTDQFYDGGDDYFQLGLESLTAAWEKKGETKRAIERLEQNAQSRYKAAYLLAGPYWLKNQHRLARLYRRVGRESDASAIETDLLKLLSLADADHPILVQLRRPRTS